MARAGWPSPCRPNSSRLLTTPSLLAPMSTRISSLSIRTTLPSTTSPCLKLLMSESCSARSSSIVVGSGPSTRGGRGLLVLVPGGRGVRGVVRGQAFGVGSGGRSAAAAPRRSGPRRRRRRRRRSAARLGGAASAARSAAGGLGGGSRGFGGGGLGAASAAARPREPRRLRRRLAARRPRSARGLGRSRLGGGLGRVVRRGAPSAASVWRRARRRRRPPRRSARTPGRPEAFASGSGVVPPCWSSVN